MLSQFLSEQQQSMCRITAPDGERIPRHVIKEALRYVTNVSARITIEVGIDQNKEVVGRLTLPRISYPICGFSAQSGFDPTSQLIFGESVN